jgi:hypothetical protein
MCKSTEKEKKILERKQQADKFSLFDDVPVEFRKYLEHLRSDRKLDYSYLQRLFRHIFRREGFEYDYVFDWTLLKFLEKSRAEAGRQLISSDKCITLDLVTIWFTPDVLSDSHHLLTSEISNHSRQRMHAHAITDW